MFNIIKGIVNAISKFSVNYPVVQFSLGMKSAIGSTYELESDKTVYWYHFKIYFFLPMFNHVYLKWAILRFGLIHDAIVTSYVGCLYLFCMLGKKRPVAIVWYQLTNPGVQFSSSQVGGNTVNFPW